MRSGRSFSVWASVMIAAVALGGLVTAAYAETKVSLVFSSGPTGGSWIPLAATTADQKMQQINPGFTRHVIPAGTGIDQEIVTFQSPTILIASAKTPEDVIYRVTKAIVEGREGYGAVFAAMKGITPKEMGQDYGLAYHPGAAKYYREIGVHK